MSLFGASCGDPGYDPIADIDKNGNISMIDISMVADMCGNPEACQAAWDNEVDPCT